MSDNTEARTTLQRYIQLAVLTLAGGAIYPLIYLRQNFEVSILDSFGITIAQLGQCYSLIGVMFVATYLPSGWLADRASPRWLLAFSLTATGLLGLWFSTLPSFDMLLLIFVGWGITTGLTFWAALIKGVAVIARHDEQGRFFGLLDGGRGLVEAILATIAVAWFAYLLNSADYATSAALQSVIYMYVGFLLLMAPVVFFALDEVEPDTTSQQERSSTLIPDLKLIVGKVEVWLAAACILSGYTLFWATYSFSGYLENIYKLGAVTAGVITVIKLWMRPIGAITAGFIGDRFNLERVLTGLMLAGTLSLAALIVAPLSVGVVFLLTIVIVVGLLTYAIRGIFWATLDSCNVPTRIKGLAIGVISLIGYSPDIFLPWLNGFLLEAYPGKTGYDYYFGVIVAVGLLGTVAAWRLKVIVSRKNGDS